MSKDRVDVSDSTAVSMPIRNMLAIIAAVGVGVWSYFGIIERLNRLETNTTLLEKDLNQAVEMVSADMEKNTEFVEKLVHINRITKVLKVGRIFGYKNRV